MLSPGAGAGGQLGIYLSPDPPPIKVAADLGTAIPGGAGNFVSFSPFASVDGDSVAFIGNGSGGQQGVYVAGPEGPPIRVADLNTAIPSGSGNFTAVPPNPIRLLNGNVAFIGDGSGGQQGVYIAALGPSPPPIRVADTNTAIPGSFLNFATFTNVAYDGTMVAFLGGNP